MEPYIPLLPEDFLVTYSDTIPGLRRFNSEGLLSTTPKTVISTLASPMLSPTYSIMLRRLQLALPMRVHDLLMTLDARQGMAANVTAGCVGILHVQFSQLPLARIMQHTNATAPGYGGKVWMQVAGMGANRHVNGHVQPAVLGVEYTRAPSL